MKWFRSWPAQYQNETVLASGALDRPHVVDGLPRLFLSNYDYSTVGEWPGTKPGICLIEWDVALDERERMQFLGEALLEPERVLAAPYLIGDSHVCRVGDDAVARGVTECDTFGFGCTYLPWKAVDTFWRTAMTAGFTDTTFSFWYREHHGPARVTWNVHPQHLHPYSDWS